MPSSRRKSEAAMTFHWRFRPVSQWPHEIVGYRASRPKRLWQVGAFEQSAEADTVCAK